MSMALIASVLGIVALILSAAVYALLDKLSTAEALRFDAERWQRAALDEVGRFRKLLEQREREHDARLKSEQQVIEAVYEMNGLLLERLETWESVGACADPGCPECRDGGEVRVHSRRPPRIVDM